MAKKKSSMGDTIMMGAVVTGVAYVVFPPFKQFVDGFLSGFKQAFSNK